MLRAATPLLSVANIDQSIDFYHCLGFAVMARTVDEFGKEPVWAMLGVKPACKAAGDNGDAANACNRPDDMDTGVIRLMLAAHGGVSHEERKMRPSFAGMVWYLECDDVPALYDRLNKAGYSPEPVDALENGAVQFFVRDPDGYEIAIISAADAAG
ncbi:VOC family protein [Thalassospira sp. NFXS8]|uniref:VOC family protein n=1 Tax=Thalassospira sp. NFXS8 TaxID=2819093 RepID=UPI0032DE6127